MEKKDIKIQKERVNNTFCTTISGRIKIEKEVVKDGGLGDFGRREVGGLTYYLEHTLTDMEILRANFDIITATENMIRDRLWEKYLELTNKG